MFFLNKCQTRVHLFSLSPYLLLNGSHFFFETFIIFLERGERRESLLWKWAVYFYNYCKPTHTYITAAEQQIITQAKNIPGPPSVSLSPPFPCDYLPLPLLPSLPQLIVAGPAPRVAIETLQKSKLSGQRVTYEEQR